MILLASTCVAHKCDGQMELWWLKRYEAMRASVEDELRVFCALETDVRGLEPFKALLDRMDEVDGVVWTFGIDKAPTSAEPYEVTTSDRLVRICTGRNLGSEYALTHGASHVMFMDTDTEPDPEGLPRLLELKRPLVFGHVPTYCLDGPVAKNLPGDSRQHWSSAGYCLVRRDVLRHVRWGWDPDEGKTDDPTFARETELIGDALGEDWSPITRHDVVGTHHPVAIVPLENRATDRWLYR